MNSRKFIIPVVSVSFAMFAILTSFRFLSLNKDIKIIVVPSKIDIGRIPLGSSKTVYVKLINQGTTSVRIEDVLATCGCTRPVLAEKILLPNKPQSLKVTFDAGKSAGNASELIRVSWGPNEDKDTISIPLKATVYKALDIFPPRMDLLQVPLYSKKHFNVLVNRLDGKRLDRLEVESDSQVRAHVRMINKNSAEIEVETQPTMTAGTRHLKFKIKSYVPHLPNFVFPISISDKGSYVISPEQVNFGVVKGILTREIIIKSGPNQSQQLKVVSAPPGISASFEKQKNSVKMKVICNPKDSHGLIDGMIIVQNNSAKIEGFRVPVLAAVE